MSLDVYLTVENPVIKTSTGVFVRQNGATVELTLDQIREMYPDEDISKYSEFEKETCEVFSANITHNLGKMADEAGLYEALWRPKELDAEKAIDLITFLAIGLKTLLSNPEHFEKYNPENGWGTYENLVNFTSEYLHACVKYPQAKIGISR